MSNLTYLRHFRFLGFAIFDLTLAFLGMYLLSGFLSKMFLKIGVIVPQRSWVLWALPIGVITHLIFGQMTPMTKNFLDLHNHYLLKIIVLVFLVVGFVGVKLAK